MKPHESESENESPPGKLGGRRGKQWGLVTPREARRIGCVNVTTLNKEEGRDRLAAKTLEEYKMDVCGLSEARWRGSGKEKIGKYTLFYSGSAGEYGVEIAINDRYVENVSAWEQVNDRIMWLRFNSKNVATTIVQCYAPHEERSKKEKDEFYACLNDVVRKVPGRDLLIIMGDFNARVYTTYGNDNTVMIIRLGVGA